MKPEDLSKSFSFLVDSLVEWAMAVRHPFQAAIKILAKARNHEQAFQNATRLWFIAFLISYIFLIPLYQLHGISWGNVGFHLIIILFYLSFYITVILAIYGSFKIFRIEIIFIDLYVYYTVLVTIFFPFINIINYPYALRYVTEIKTLKASGKRFIDMPLALMQKIDTWSSSFLFDLYHSLSQFIVIIFFLAMLTCVVYALSFRYDIARHKLIDALTLGLCISIFPAIVFGVFFIFLLYAFL